MAKPDSGRSCVGLLAHVDAGKTTLSEALLYEAGAIRSPGRVDHGDAFLDHFEQERRRGITIFSKQAVLSRDGRQLTLLDTPGHADFAAEAERTLDILDCAVLVISATDGVQSHTRTLWELLRERKIPTFLFVNKTDLPCPARSELLAELRRELGEGVYDAEKPDAEGMALCADFLLERYLKSGSLSETDIREGIRSCSLFPCRFGAALRLNGTAELLDDLLRLAPATAESSEFAARVYKISHEGETRLTHLKVLGGVLRVRDTVGPPDCREKISRIRSGSGAKMTQVEAAYPGDVVIVTGLSSAHPGDGLGAAAAAPAPKLEPVLQYEILLPPDCDVHRAWEQLSKLAEEEPELRLTREERSGQIGVRMMGPVQMDVLRELAESRFGLSLRFGPGKILYRETIADTVEGVGHFEPLRHYAEVHLLLEPGEPGSGMVFGTDCPEDSLERNWQRLVLTHLMERTHIGVLIGAPLTDMKITLKAGRAHIKHTEGGDFRQATYRAIRQGLMQAESVLLEPQFRFRIEVPQEMNGRILSDLTRIGADPEPPELNGGTAVLRGTAPVSVLRDYPTELQAVTHGLGKITLQAAGYAPCRNADEVIQSAAYNPLEDPEHSPHSVFCSHGAGIVVPWNEVFARMHLPSVLHPPVSEPELRSRAADYCARVAEDKELAAIFERTYGPIKRKLPAGESPVRSSRPKPAPVRSASREEGPEYLLVDGYNIIFAWDDLRAIAEENLDAARHRLTEILRNYQGFRRSPIILVFDAYKVKGNPGSLERLGGLDVVYTREAETADMYIEKATYDLSGKHRVRVATSDGLEQMIILGHGALRVSAASLEEEIHAAEAAIRRYLTEK